MSANESAAPPATSQPQWAAAATATAATAPPAQQQPQWTAGAAQCSSAPNAPLRRTANATAVWTRENEHELEALVAQEAAQETPLTPAQRARLAQLSETYQAFLDQGIARLEAGARERNDALSGGGGSLVGGALSVAGTAVGATGRALAAVGKGAFFWGSLLGTAVPGYLGKHVMGLTPNFCHWNWISDRLILGAIPVVTQFGGSGNHLALLGKQTAERGAPIGLVVSCVEQAELDGYGVGVLKFAGPAAWAQTLGVMSYEHLPMPDNSADVAYEDVRRVVDRMHVAMHERRTACYVHCKAGKGRSWMVVMCYLLTHGGMAFDTAAVAVKGARAQVNPCASQRQFAQSFALRWHADRVPVPGAPSSVGGAPSGEAKAPGAV